MSKDNPLAGTAITNAETGYVRQAQLIQIMSFSASTLWRKVRAGQFPKPLKLSKNITAWKTEDVRAWMREREGAAGVPG